MAAQSRFSNSACCLSATFQACLSLVCDFSTSRLQIWFLTFLLRSGISPPDSLFLTIMKLNFLFKVNPSSDRRRSPSGSDGETQWELSFVREEEEEEEEEKQTPQKYFPNWAARGKACQGWNPSRWLLALSAWSHMGVVLCGVFVGVLVVLDPAHTSWISGGKPSHSREQLITSVSHQPHCLRRDDKWAGPHVWLWQPRGTGSSWHLRRGADSRGGRARSEQHFREPLRAFWELKRTLRWLRVRGRLPPVSEVARAVVF